MDIFKKVIAKAVDSKFPNTMSFPLFNSKRYQKNLKKIYTDYIEDYEEFYNLTDEDILKGLDGYEKVNKIPNVTSFNCRFTLEKEQENYRIPNAVKVCAYDYDGNFIGKLGNVPLFKLNKINSIFDDITEVYAFASSGPYKYSELDSITLKQKITYVDELLSLDLLIVYKNKDNENNISNFENED